MKFSEKLITILKITISVGLILFIWNYVDSQNLFQKLKDIRLPEFIVAAALMYLSIFICGVRYFIFVRDVSSLKITKVLNLYFIGHFFNIFVPGYIAGDIVKVYQVGKHGGGKVFLAMTILLERYFGIFALSSLSLGLMFYGGVDELLPLQIKITLYILFGGGTLAYIVLLSGAYRLFNFITFLKTHFSDNLDNFGGQKLLVTFGLSLLNQCIYLTLNYFLALSLNIKLDFSVLAPVVAVTTIISTLPVSFQGLGIREGIFVYLLAQYGVSKEQALLLGILTFVVNALVALLGGIFFLAQKKESGDITGKTESV